MSMLNINSLAAITLGTSNFSLLLNFSAQAPMATGK
jgi:hypothetical protein